MHESAGIRLPDVATTPAPRQCRARGEVVDERALAQGSLELAEGLAVEDGGAGLADAPGCGHLGDGEARGVEPVVLGYELPLLRLEAAEGVVDAAQLSRAQQVVAFLLADECGKQAVGLSLIVVVLRVLLRVEAVEAGDGALSGTELHGRAIATDGAEHHPAAPVTGVCGEAALCLLVVAQGGFAQAQESFLPEVFQTDAVAAHPPGHCSGQGHVADDEQTCGGGQLAEFLGCSFQLLYCLGGTQACLNILSHFRFLSVWG